MQLERELISEDPSINNTEAKCVACGGQGQKPCSLWRLTLMHCNLPEVLTFVRVPNSNHENFIKKGGGFRFQITNKVSDDGAPLCLSGAPESKMVVQRCNSKDAKQILVLNKNRENIEGHRENITYSGSQLKFEKIEGKDCSGSDGDGCCVDFYGAATQSMRVNMWSCHSGTLGKMSNQRWTFANSRLVSQYGPDGLGGI